MSNVFFNNYLNTADKLRYVPYPLDVQGGWMAPSLVFVFILSSLRLYLGACPFQSCFFTFEIHVYCEFDENRLIHIGDIK